MKNWFVVNTKPKKEFHLEKILSEADIPAYNPKYRDQGQVKPFFPGYQFIFFDFPEQYKLIKYTRGVKRIVGNDEGPIPIEVAVLDEIRKREVDGYVEFQKHGVEPELGDEIEVAEGPLKGLRGIFKKDLTDQDRVLILLSYVSYQGQLLIEKKKLKKIVR
jgi:transcriptional antiterminator RfaH